MEDARPKVSPGLNRGLWVMMTCLSGFISNQWAALVGTSTVGDLYLGVGEAHGKSPSLLKFVVNPKLLKEKKKGRMRK